MSAQEIEIQYDQTDEPSGHQEEGVEIPFERINEGIDLMRNGKVIRPVLIY